MKLLFEHNSPETLFFFARATLCWETILHWTLTFLHILQFKTLIFFVPDYILKNVWMNE